MNIRRWGCCWQRVRLGSSLASFFRINVSDGSSSGDKLLQGASRFGMTFNV